MTDDTPPTIGRDPDAEPTARERLAVLIEDRLDIPMAVLAVVWAALVAYDLVAPASLRDELTLAGNVIWIIFIVEFLVKLTVSGRPLRYLRRHWPSVLFLVLPALRLFRVLRAVRALRALPAARVLGSSYRAVGTARNLLQGRLGFLLAATGIATFSSAQLLYLLERARPEGVDSLGDALWWSANLSLTGTLVFEPVTLVGRALALALAAYSVVVFASVAATLGAFFIESRAERAASEEPDEG